MRAGPAKPRDAVHGQVATQGAPLSVTVTGGLCAQRLLLARGPPSPRWSLFYPKEAGALGERGIGRRPPMPPAPPAT